MVENFENYDELIGRLKSGNHLTFRNDLDLLAQKFGSLRPLDDVAELFLENKELRRVIVELIAEPAQRHSLLMLAFHSTRQVGVKAIPYIREEWKRNSDAKWIHYLHMCLIDIIGAGNARGEEDERLRPIIAEQEIPLWIEMLQDGESKPRGLLAYFIGALAEHVPARAKQAGELLISFLYDVDDELSRRQAVRGLIYIGDKNLLQEAFLHLARVAARGDTPLELLLTMFKDVDVNARDGWGKTALTYAKESGNERLVEMLRKAGANEQPKEIRL